MEKIDQKFQRLKRKIEEQERKVFHKHFSTDEADLYQELLQHKPKIDKLLKEKIIKKEQYNLLLPASKRTNSETLDHTILHVLLRNLCGYTKPVTGWDKEPRQKDVTEIAHLIRLKIGRNKISHFGISEINNKNYKKLYRYLKKPLLALGCNVRELDELIPKPVRFKYTPAVPDFAFRNDEIKELNYAIQYSQNTTGVIAVAVSGFSGTGKTQLVKKYFEQNSKTFDHAIVWINASAMEESFLELAKTIKIATTDQNNQDKEINVIINEVHQYFQDDRILFVFDNVEVPKDEEMENKLIKFIPMGHRISTIITSQTEIKWQQIKQLKLKQWRFEDAIQFITKRLIGEPSDITEILHIIDCNTFAIRQVISHCIGTRTSLHDYLQLLKNKPKTLSSQSKVFKAINISIDRLECSNPEALDLLQLMVFLDGKDIKRGLFISKYQDDDVDSIEKRNEINESLHILENRSIIEIGKNTCSSTEDVISVHSLIQQTLMLFPRRNERLIDIFNNHMLMLLGNNQRTEDELLLADFIFFKYCCNHLIFIFNSVHYFRTEFLKICSDQMGRFVTIFYFKGRLKFAISLFDNIKKSNIFENDTQRSYQLESCIGYAQYFRRNFKQASTILLNISEKQKRLLGVKHPDYLRSALGYVRCLGFIGEYKQGLDLCQKLYKLHVDVLGCFHPQTLICKRAVGIFMYLTGDRRSFKIYEEVLEAQIKNHGSIHPEVFVTRVASIFYKEEDIKVNKVELKELIDDQISLYGGEHLMLAVTLINFAVNMWHEGLLDEAYEYAQLCLQIFLNEYEEEDHIDVANAEYIANSIQSEQCEKYNRNDARKHYHDHAKRIRKILGSKHPEVKNYLRNTVIFYFHLYKDYIPMSIIVLVFAIFCTYLVKWVYNFLYI